MDFIRELTKREQEIVALVSKGLSNKEIARSIEVADATVKVHLHNIFIKLDVTSRAKLAVLALKQLRKQENDDGTIRTAAEG
jgi:DNA-binding NarL/FixJ family response regulator